MIAVSSPRDFIQRRSAMVLLEPGMMMMWAGASSAGLVTTLIRQPARRKGLRSSWFETRGRAMTAMFMGWVGVLAVGGGLVLAGSTFPLNLTFSLMEKEFGARAGTAPGGL